jgi:uncharacterized protein YqgC (DUF456 family)
MDLTFLLDLFLSILAFSVIILGLIGCIIPVIPGPILTYGGMLILHATDKFHFSSNILITLAIVVAVVALLDYVVPVWGTKKMGGTRMGMIGSTVGLIVGLFFGPIGIILGPFLGAVGFELISGQSESKALMSGLGSFLGFLFGTIMKVVVVFIMTYYAIAEVITKL